MGAVVWTAKPEVFKVGKLYHLIFYIRYRWKRHLYARRLEQMRRLG